MAGQSPLIMVVDDQAGVRRLVEEVFRQAGYRVKGAAHGQEALRLVGEEPPSLAILDVKMPVMDGLDTLRALRRILPDLPVVMMTAVGDGHQAAEAVSLGARELITKPFDVFHLRSLAKSILEE